MDLGELKFSTRTINCLVEAGIHSLDDICSKTAKQLLTIKNLGRKSLNEIHEKLWQLGRTLTDEPKPGPSLAAIEAWEALSALKARYGISFQKAAYLADRVEWGRRYEDELKEMSENNA